MPSSENVRFLGHQTFFGFQESAIYCRYNFCDLLMILQMYFAKKYRIVLNKKIFFWKERECMITIYSWYVHIVHTTNCSSQLEHLANVDPTWSLVIHFGYRSITFPFWHIHLYYFLEVEEMMGVPNDNLILKYAQMLNALFRFRYYKKKFGSLADTFFKTKNRILIQISQYYQ